MRYTKQEVDALRKQHSRACKKYKAGAYFAKREELHQENSVASRKAAREMLIVDDMFMLGDRNTRSTKGYWNDKAARRTR